MSGCAPNSGICARRINMIIKINREIGLSFIICIEVLIREIAFHGFIVCVGILRGER